MFRKLGLVYLALLIAGPAAAYHEFSGGPIIVNGQELSSQKGYALMQYYGVIPAGNYWYDPVSGLWGNAGGPGAGQIAPGLDLGGRLQANASGGGTGVFINGREIHRREYGSLLQLYGSVIPGRYWMNAQLIGGFEGGPAIFNLNAAAGNAGQGSASGSGSGYNTNTYGGGLMSDGNCSGYLHPNGTSVMTGNC
jgi:hypothetical protein